ncbi:MAG: class I SAM-dependent methyltransferase [Rickettsiales bacterium]|jgi:SAM-dependent methyltransferase|nr:class I SAM-dependent methyltransferase [Rickettsiales bacterium]
MDEIDRSATVEHYQNSYFQHGYSPKSLGWDKGRQDIRFEVLLSFFKGRGYSILDIGCGFGDLNRELIRHRSDSYKYTGIDLVCELINEGRKQYPQKNVTFINGDFLQYSFEEKFDIVVASGIFNYKFPTGGNDIFVEKVLQKAWSICNEGMAFDFLSNKIDFSYDHTYHNSPEHILYQGYRLSRQIVLRNDYIPFEFCLYIGKDESFDRDTPVFNIYKQLTGRL